MTFAIFIGPSPAATKRRKLDVGLTLVQRRGPWTNVTPTLIQRLVSGVDVVDNLILITACFANFDGPNVLDKFFIV